MSLVRSKELFLEPALPVRVDSVMERTLIQNELHRHEYFEMLYVQRGTLVNRFKEGEVRMKAGDVLIMKPYVLHVLDDRRRSPQHQAYCCSFLPQAVDNSIHSLEEVKASRSPNRYFFRSFLALAEEGVPAVQLRIPRRKQREFADLLAKLKEVSREHSEKGQARARCRFLHLLAFLSEQHEEEQQSSELVPTSTMGASVPESRYQAGIREVLSYIHDHFEEPLTLTAMAAMSGASETYFCRLFKHETGVTFLNYLNGLRIERACVLLRDSTDSALDICYRVGFNDYTHFSRQFKKHTGLSPAEYRRRQRGSGGAGAAKPL